MLPLDGLNKGAQLFLDFEPHLTRTSHSVVPSLLAHNSGRIQGIFRLDEVSGSWSLSALHLLVSLHLAPAGTASKIWRTTGCWFALFVFLSAPIRKYASLITTRSIYPLGNKPSRLRLGLVAVGKDSFLDS